MSEDVKRALEAATDAAEKQADLYVCMDVPEWDNPRETVAAAIAAALRSLPDCLDWKELRSHRPDGLIAQHWDVLASAFERAAKDLGDVNASDHQAP